MRIRSSRLKTLCVKTIGGAYVAPVALAALAALSFEAMSVSPAGAKTPGSTYCYYGTCHRVKSIAETEAVVGKEETLVASHYDSCKKDRYNPCGLTSSGEAFNPESEDNAASPVYPDGTKLLVWSPDTGAAVVLRINNAGPYWGNRKLDVSRGAAERLGFAGKGVATLKVRVLDAPTAEEAAYKRNRTYDPVPGYIGRFANAEGAQVAMASVAALETLASFVGVPAMSESMTLARTGMLGKNLPPLQVAKAEPARKEVRKPRAPDMTPEQILTAPFVTAVQVAAMIFEGPKPAILTSAAPRRAARNDVAASRAVNRRAERVAAAKARPTRAARIAVVKSGPGNRNRVATLEQKSKAPASSRRQITSDGTNDISVFSRHAQPSQTYRRAQAEERSRRHVNRYRQTAALHRGRNRGDG